VTNTAKSARHPTASGPGAKRPPRIALVGSSGGHLAQLLALKPFWQQHDRFWVTFNSQDAISQLGGERVYWCYQPTNRNIPNLLRNTVLAARLLRRERPNLIISTGAGAAIPYFWLAPLFGAKSAFIEVADRLDRPSLTGRIIRPIATSILVQWPEQQRLYPNASVVGPLL
jgi:UDP-N-acetylglucosamine:LPS N-acetylglucosamine transferase